MTKKALNQNAKYVQDLRDIFEFDFNFSNKPLNRFKIIHNNEESTQTNPNKEEELLELKRKINSIEDCN